MRFLPTLISSLALGLVLAACAPDRAGDESEADAMLERAAGILTEEDALAAQEAGIAAFRSGQIGADAFLMGMAGFASHPDPEVVMASTRYLDFIYEEFPDVRRGLAQHVGRAYGRPYRAARASDTDEARGLSASLGSVMAREGNDQEARNFLIRQGSLYLELDPTREDLKPTVPTHLLGSAFEQTLPARPDLAFEPLINLAESGDEFERVAALQGLTATSRDDQLERLLEWSIASENPVPESVRSDLWVGLMKTSENRETVWNWVEDNIERVPAPLRQAVPRMAEQFCSQDGAASVAVLLQDTFPADSDEALIEIEQCAALKDLQGASIVEALTL